MKSIKVFGALVLLLLSSSGFSFEQIGTGTVSPGLAQESTREFSAGLHVNYDCNLSSPVYFHKIPLFTHSLPSFRFCSSHRERIAKRYLGFSGLIVPGLGVQEIIFPFHSFL